MYNEIQFVFRFSFRWRNWKTKSRLIWWSLSQPSKHSSWWRRLRDILMKMNIFLLIICLQKTSPRRLGQDQYIRLVHMSSRHLQDVLPRCLQEVFKASSRHVSQIRPEDIQHVCKTYCKDRCLQKDSLRSHFWEIYGNCTKCARVINISQVLVSHFTTPFSGWLERRI